MRTAKRLGGFGSLAARGCRAGLTNQGLRPRRNHARGRLVGPEHRLEVFAVFAAQYLEKLMRLNFAFTIFMCDGLNIFIHGSKIKHPTIQAHGFDRALLCVDINYIGQLYFPA